VQISVPNGGKRFLSGGRIAGCYFSVADKLDGAIVICEGMATGVSIHEGTKLATVWAMNCGNCSPWQRPIAREMARARNHSRLPNSDTWTVGNPGLDEATEAAKAVGAKLAVPRFKDTSTKRLTQRS